MPLYDATPVAIRPRLPSALHRVYALALALSCLGGTVSAQGTSSAPASAPAPTPAESPAASQQVEIVGGGSNEQRKVSIVAKQIVAGDELRRYGDASLASALQHVPGVSVSSDSAHEFQIRLRGLGSGYTQILINGDPAPAGFSIESLSPELIDHIELLRSATADMSAQAIAGTVNIVLLRPKKRRAPDVKASASRAGKWWSNNVAADADDHAGEFSYGLNANVGLTRDAFPSLADEVDAGADGEPEFRQITATTELLRQTVLGLTPRLSWKSAGGSTIDFNGLIQGRHSQDNALESRDVLLGVPAPIALDDQTSLQNARQFGGTIEGKTRLGQDSSLEAKIVLSKNARSASSVFNGQDASAAPVLRRTVHSDLDDDSLAASGKLSLSVVDDHTATVGWDGQSTRRTESRAQVETSPQPNYPVMDLDQDFTARVGRMALFLQDEWVMTRGLSSYLGVRWESLHTTTSGTDLAPVVIRSDALSPTFQATWKVPDTKSDQVRLGIAHTYKAPTAKELIPRPWLVNDNSATTPDFEGSPSLRPELAWGADLGYEHYVGEDGLLAANAYARRIDNVIMRHVSLVGDRWVETPFNDGTATVFGIELEASGKLRRWFASLPDISWRSGLTRNWSRLESLAAPGNRLASQTPIVASAGLDWRVNGLPMTVGGDFKYEKGGFTRTSVTQSEVVDRKRILAIYGLWRVWPDTSLRLSVDNALAPDDRRSNQYESEGLDQRLVTTTRTFSSVTLQLEVHL